MKGGYDRALVERLLPACWDVQAAYGLKDEQQADQDMPKSKADPSHAGTLLAHLTDIRSAWQWATKLQGLTPGEAQAVILRYGLDWTEREVGLQLGVSQQAISKRCEKAVGKLAAHLNGTDYIDGYDDIKEEAA
ncbi:DNA binding protein [Streptomyces phage phiScoe44]|nr:DNA binding protein [Streptomyces phage phiScoe44]